MVASSIRQGLPLSQQGKTGLLLQPAHPPSSQAQAGGCDSSGIIAHLWLGRIYLGLPACAAGAADNAIRGREEGLFRLCQPPPSSACSRNTCLASPPAQKTLCFKVELFPPAQSCQFSPSAFSFPPPRCAVCARKIRRPTRLFPPGALYSVQRERMMLTWQRPSRMTMQLRGCGGQAMRVRPCPPFQAPRPTVMSLS